MWRNLSHFAGFWMQKDLENMISGAPRLEAALRLTVATTMDEGREGRPAISVLSFALKVIAVCSIQDLALAHQLPPRDRFVVPAPFEAPPPSAVMHSYDAQCHMAALKVVWRSGGAGVRVTQLELRDRLNRRNYPARQQDLDRLTGWLKVLSGSVIVRARCHSDAAGLDFIQTDNPRDPKIVSVTWIKGQLNFISASRNLRQTR